jgi:HIRAN domain
VAERLRLWLERGSTEEGRGYWLRDAATEEPLRWRDERIRVVKVAGASYRAEALQDAAFDPGRRLALVPEPDNEHDPNALGIWNEERTLQAGYVPAEVAGEIPRDWQAVSLWEFRDEGDARIGLRVLLAPPEAWIGMPR